MKTTSFAFNYVRCSTNNQHTSNVNYLFWFGKHHLPNAVSIICRIQMHICLNSRVSIISNRNLRPTKLCIIYLVLRSRVMAKEYRLINGIFRTSLYASTVFWNNFRKVLIHKQFMQPQTFHQPKLNRFLNRISNAQQTIISMFNEHNVKVNW